MARRFTEDLAPLELVGPGSPPVLCGTYIPEGFTPTVTIDTTGMRDWTLTFEVEMRMLPAKESYLAMVWCGLK